MSEIFIGCMCFVLGCFFSEACDKYKNKKKKENIEK